MLENSTTNSDAQYIDLIANSFDKINSYKETIKDCLRPNIYLTDDYVIHKDYDFGEVTWNTIYRILSIKSLNKDLGILWDAPADYTAYIFVVSKNAYTRWYVRNKKVSSREYIKARLEEFPGLGYFILRVESVMPDVINWLKMSL